MPASIITLFCIGAVTSAANAPVAQASIASRSIASTACALVGSGWPGDHRRGERVVPHLDHAARVRERRRIEVGVARREADALRARGEELAVADEDEPCGKRCRPRGARASIAHSSGPMPAGSPTVMATTGRSTSLTSGCTAVCAAASPQSSACTPRRRTDCDVRRRLTSTRACAKPASAVVGPAEHPQELERMRGDRSRRCAARRGRAAARGLRARTPGNWSSFAR